MLLKVLGPKVDISKYMIGKDFKRLGSEHHILSKIGDGEGDPFYGPVKLCFAQRDVLVVLCPRSIHTSMQSICVYNSSATKTELVYADMFEHNHNSETISPLYIGLELQPTCVCVIPSCSGKTLFGVTDKSHTVKFVDTSSHSIVDSYGQFGAGAGDLSHPISMDSFSTGIDNIYCVLEGGGNQRIQFFNESMKSIVLFGSLGHNKGQFFDATDVACLSFQNSLYKNKHPEFYKGFCSLEELNGLLFDEYFEGNFLMCCLQKSMFGKEFHILHLSADKRLHHIIICKDAITGCYVVADDRVNSLENKHQHQLVESSFAMTSLSSSSSSSTTSCCKGVVDLLKSQRKYSFSFGADSRPFATVAVADRGNKRVQIFRMFWERSEWYEPAVELLFVVGGSREETIKLEPSNKNVEKKKRWRFVNLIDPVSVAYASIGELAVCDSGAGKVYILSGNMDVVKTITMNFLSDDILAKSRRSRAAANAYSKFTTSVRERDPFDSIDSLGRERRQDPTDHLDSKPRFVADINLSPPCSVAFNKSGSLAIGYKNGGIYIFEPIKTKNVGLFSKLQHSILERVVIQYLEYADLQSLRNCCIFLHEFTRDLRLSWRIFPPLRSVAINCVVSLFVNWATVESPGLGAYFYGVSRLSEVISLRNDRGDAICKRYLNLQCPDRHCSSTHSVVTFDRQDIHRRGAYLQHQDFLYFLEVVFDSKFVWKYEKYIDSLFDAYAVDRRVIKVSSTKRYGKRYGPQEKSVETLRVLYFKQYLEVMTTLEEHYSGLKDIHSHKLFKPIFKQSQGTVKNKQYVPPYDIDSIDPRVYIDRLEQYDRGIDVPFRNFKGATIITKKGMEKAEKEMPSKVAEHIDIFDYNATKATHLLNTLFK